MSVVLDNITYIHNPEGHGSQLIIDTLHSCYSHALIDCIFSYHWVLEDLPPDTRIVVRQDEFIEFPHNLDMLNDTRNNYKGVYGELMSLITDKPVLFSTDHIFEHTYIYPKDNKCSRSIWNSRSVYPDRVALTDTPIYNDSIIKEKLDNFSNYVLRRLNIVQPVKKSIIVIERMHDRKIHRSIMRQLMYYGEMVSVVYLENMTFYQQVELFQSGNVFIMAHGSAEINLIFAPVNSIVFEFDNIPGRDVIYKRLCCLRGLTHVVLPHDEDLDVKAKIFDYMV